MEETSLYPYLILLPDNEKKQKEILSTVFGSEIAQEIIINIDSGLIFQKDLISNLAASNKTIISYLKKFVELGILKEDSKIISGHRRLFYILTPMGEWFSSLVVYREYKPEEFKKKLEQLFQIYLSHSIGLLIDNNFSQQKIRDIFEFSLSSNLKDDYITRSTFKRYFEGIKSLSEELTSIKDSIFSMDEENRVKLLENKNLKNIFMELDEFYGILKDKVQILNEKLKKI